MASKDQYMLELGVFSEGMHFMVMMHQSRRSLLARPAIAGQDGAVCVVDLERTKRQRQQRIRKRSQRTRKHQSKYMLLRILKMEWKVRFATRATCYSFCVLVLNLDKF